MRRTVATLLVVASPLLMAAPVSAQQDRPVGPSVVPAAPAVSPGVTPTAPASASTVATPTAVPALAVVVPDVGTPHAPAIARHVLKTERTKAPTADANDSAYAARLQAELCQARQIFCGLDRNGRYPAG